MRKNIHLHVAYYNNRKQPKTTISIHAPTWGATYDDWYRDSRIQFQSTHPRGVRPRLRELFSSRVDISIHAPTWGATNDRTTLGNYKVFQSTHPRGVRLDSAKEEVTVQSISIHAPTWGATRYISVRVKSVKISIHAPTWGATCISSTTDESNPDFNPRTHVGCDLRDFLSTSIWTIFQSTHPRGVRPNTKAVVRASSEFQSTHPRGVRPAPTIPRVQSSTISIHAPTWGATPNNKYFLCDLRFQSTHPRGVRQSIKQFFRFQNLFQSTHPRGVRPQTFTLFFVFCYFNPRTHVGCDTGIYKDIFTVYISIHAPTWGATFYLSTLSTLCGISIHAPTWGAT